MTFIPEGEYCYEIEKIDTNTGRIKVKLCDFYHKGFCKKLKIELDDQVKDCLFNIK